MAGISSSENKGKVVQWFEAIREQEGVPIKSVLDVGCGFGIWSILLKKPEQYWTGLEVFYPYAKMFDLREKYNSLYFGDARYMDYGKIGGSWDLVILADVLEHMWKDEAKDVIAELLARSWYLLISVPVEHQHQTAGNEGNDFETHIDHWTAADMEKYLKGFKKTHRIKEMIVGDVCAYYLVEQL